MAALAALMMATAPAVAYHIGDTYGRKGFVWLATYYNYAEIWVESDRCNARELDAYEAVRASTAGTTQFDNRWPSGLRFIRDPRVGAGCTGIMDDYDDIRIRYSDFRQTHPEIDEAWGRNVSDLAPREWCEIWGVNYPCGTHFSKVIINTRYWDVKGALWRQRLIMHETGHSMGLAHHCLSDSIMNTPAYNRDSCTEANWTDVMVYMATDRNGILNIYPDYLYL